MTAKNKKRNGKWIWTSDWTQEDSRSPRLVWFYTEIEGKGGKAAGTDGIRITADCRYKVYIDGKNWFNFERTDIAVIGLNRFKKYAIESVDPQLIENVRFQVIHKPVVLQILDYEECIEGWSWWGRTAQDKREAKEFAENWEDLLETVRKRNRPD